VQRFQENKFLLRRHKGAIVFNLRPTGNCDELPGKFTFFQALVMSLCNIFVFLSSPKPILASSLELIILYRSNCAIILLKLILPGIHKKTHFELFFQAVLKWEIF